MGQPCYNAAQHILITVAMVGVKMITVIIIKVAAMVGKMIIMTIMDGGNHHSALCLVTD